jgi:hypothetical protein
MVRDASGEASWWQVGREQRRGSDTACEREEGAEVKERRIWILRV